MKTVKKWTLPVLFAVSLIVGLHLMLKSGRITTDAEVRYMVGAMIAFLVAGVSGLVMGVMLVISLVRSATRSCKRTFGMRLPLAQTSWTGRRYP